MRRGCISLGNVQCDECHQIIPYPERYLAIGEEEGKTSRYCLNCCLKKGYARYKDEKGEPVITLFPEPESIDKEVDYE